MDSLYLGFAGIIIFIIIAYFKIELKLYFKGWRKIDMPLWVSKKYYAFREKAVPYGRTYFYKGDNFIYRVYTSHPKLQGNSGKIICYRKLNKT